MKRFKVNLSFEIDESRLELSETEYEHEIVAMFWKPTFRNVQCNINEVIDEIEPKPFPMPGDFK